MIGNFPEFTPINLDNRDSYDDAVSNHPAYSNLSFPSMQIWNNFDGTLAAARHNDNLVIDYSVPLDEENSGLSVIGTSDVDNSLNTVFDHLRTTGQEPKIVHVPEFVVSNITDADMFEIVEEPDYNEYILDSQALATLEGPDFGRIRRKVGKFHREIDGYEIQVGAIDMSSDPAKAEVMEHVKRWVEAKDSGNDPDKTEFVALDRTLGLANELGMQGMELRLSGKLAGILLYHKPHDDSYIVNHLRVDYSHPFIFDYMTHAFAKIAVQNNIPRINFEMDLGIEGLRRHKVGLRPIEMFKQYLIKQKADSREVES
ncbi:MAG: hypothetical protein JWO07_866 [Candidatus Saccharibacteria bacterium]|nr:hypothetical protein [Candidatus Saccharibacteria bacterium]